MSYSQSATDFTDIRIVRQLGRVRSIDDLQVGHPREIGRDAFAHAIGKNAIRIFSSDALEGEDGDALVRNRSRPLAGWNVGSVSPGQKKEKEREQNQERKGGRGKGRPNDIPMAVHEAPRAINEGARPCLDRVALEEALNILRHGGNGRITECRILSEGEKNDRIEIAAQVTASRLIGSAFARPLRLLLENANHFLMRGTPGRELVRGRAGEQFIKQRAQRVDIARRGDLFAARLLRRDTNRSESLLRRPGRL